MYVAIRILMFTFFLWSTSAVIKLSDYDDKRRETIWEWHKICEDVTGMTDDAIHRLKAGDFKDYNSMNMKKYLLCMWRVAGIMSTDLEFRWERLEQYLPKRMDTEGVKTMVQDCLEEGKKSGQEKYEKIFTMQECLYKKNPNDILMF